MTSYMKPSLFQENKIINKEIKKKNLELLINYYNSFNLSEDNKSKFLEFLLKESRKNNSFLKKSYRFGFESYQINLQVKNISQN